MKNLAPGTNYTEPFAVSSTPDATPSAIVYAGSTAIGSASVAADTGANAYIATVTLPSTGLTDGAMIRVKVSWAVGGTAYSGWLDVGVVNLYAVQAAAVLSAAANTPIPADMRLLNGQPPQPLGYVPARQDTVEEVLGAVEGIEGGAGGVVLVPLLGQIQSRTEGTTIRVFTRETTTLTMAVVNAIGEAVDLSEVSLRLVFERRGGGDLVVLEDEQSTKTESSIAFAVPDEISQAEGSHTWALRDSSGTVLMQGPLIVEYAPEVDT